MRQIRYLFVTFAVRRHVAPVGQAKKSLGLVEAGKSQALESTATSEQVVARSFVLIE